MRAEGRCGLVICFTMASLIPKNGVIFNHADTAPAPSKDYCQILVTVDKVKTRHNLITKLFSNLLALPCKMHKINRSFSDANFEADLFCLNKFDPKLHG